MPCRIVKDKIGESSVKLQFSQEEAWTRSLRHVLLALKILLKWTTNGANGWYKICTLVFSSIPESSECLDRVDLVYQREYVKCSVKWMWAYVDSCGWRAFFPNRVKVIGLLSMEDLQKSSLIVRTTLSQRLQVADGFDGKTGPSGLAWSYYCTYQDFLQTVFQRVLIPVLEDFQTRTPSSRRIWLRRCHFCAIMGLLYLGTPLSWDEAKKYAYHVRFHGITQFLHTWDRLKDRQGDELLWGDEVFSKIVDLPTSVLMMISPIDRVYGRFVK